MASETDVLSDILNWSKNRPLWQQHALYQLYTSGLSDIDVEKLLNICKGNITDPECLNEANMNSPDNSAKEVAIKGISDVINVNALAPDQKLPINPIGMTIIYGDNGSGKSGYIRILKQCCRTRNRGSVIRNIYSSSMAKAEAKIRYKENNRDHDLSWIEGTTPDTPLTTVSIFDSSTANVHVDSANDIAYMPFSMELLLKLAEICKIVASKLQAEIAIIKSKTPKALLQSAINQNTQAGRLLNNLSSNTKIEDLNALTSFSTEENKRYETLCSDLAIDPKKAIDELNRKRIKLEEIAKKCKTFYETIDEESHQKLKSLKTDLEIKIAAANVAASEQFKDEPLPGIGSDVWKTLWDSAKIYSEQGAYPGKSFPNTAEDAVCVLCQQTLSQEAIHRMKKFQSFIMDDTKQKETVARESYNTHLKNIEKHRMKHAEAKSLYLFLTENLDDEELSEAIRHFCIMLLLRVRAILRFTDNIPTPPLFPQNLFDSQHNSILSRISDLADSKTANKRQLLENEKKEFEARKALLIIQNDIISEIERKKEIQQLEKLIKDETATDGITRKSTDISKQLITDTLRAQFAKEAAALKISNLAIELQQTKSDLASPQFKVSLTRSPKTKVGNILSEGEFRCVAIASAQDKK